MKWLYILLALAILFFMIAIGYDLTFGGTIAHPQAAWCPCQKIDKHQNHHIVAREIIQGNGDHELAVVQQIADKYYGGCLWGPLISDVEVGVKVRKSPVTKRKILY